MIRFALGLGLLLVGCSPSPSNSSGGYPWFWGPPKAPVTSLSTLIAAYDWQYESGEELNAAWNTGTKKLLGKMSQSDVIRVIQEAGFSCTSGESQKNHPEPTAVCASGFATRDCQINWEIASTSAKGKVQVDGSFKRDCALADRDWPDKVNSAIDDGLAPQMPPAAPN